MFLRDFLMQIFWPNSRHSFSLALTLHPSPCPGAFTSFPSTLMSKVVYAMNLALCPFVHPILLRCQDIRRSHTQKPLTGFLSSTQWSAKHYVCALPCTVQCGLP